MLLLCHPGKQWRCSLTERSPFSPRFLVVPPTPPHETDPADAIADCMRGRGLCGLGRLQHGCGRYGRQPRAMRIAGWFFFPPCHGLAAGVQPWRAWASAGRRLSTASGWLMTKVSSPHGALTAFPTARFPLRAMMCVGHGRAAPSLSPSYASTPHRMCLSLSFVFFCFLWSF